jgi:hypothetical protein
VNTIPRQFAWDDARKAELADLWSKGYSARKIAEMMGVGSRNAVLGLRQRMGLPKRRDAFTQARGEYRARVKEREARKKPPRPRVPVELRRPRAVVIPAVEMPSLNIRFADRKPWECSYIAGEPTAEAVCCGHRVKPGSSYCGFHHSVVWVRVERVR